MVFPSYRSFMDPGDPLAGEPFAESLISLVGVDGAERVVRVTQAAKIRRGRFERLSRDRERQDDVVAQLVAEMAMVHARFLRLRAAEMVARQVRRDADRGMRYRTSR